MLRVLMPWVSRVLCLAWFCSMLIVSASVGFLARSVSMAW